MKRYQQIYENAVSKRYKARNNYASIQFSSPEIISFNKFKKAKKDILYFYLIAIVVIAAILLIICTKHNELFTKIWVIYLAILVLNTILMFITLGIIKQIKENKAIKARIKEEEQANEAKTASDDLAKICICLMALENHNCYLSFAKKNGNLEEKTAQLLENYKQIVNEVNNNLATSDDFISFYQEILINEEKEGL